VNRSALSRAPATVLRGETDRGRSGESDSYDLQAVAPLARYREDQQTRQSFETLTFDWNLPDITGIDVLRRLRANSKVAVLFCTARAEVDDVVKGLSEGADDYLIKPLRRLELLARIESVARRAGQVQAKDDAVSIGDLQANFIGRNISRSWHCA